MISDWSEMSARLDELAEQGVTPRELIDALETELRPHIRDAMPDLQRKAAAMFAGGRTALTGKKQPHVAMVGKRGPALRLVVSNQGGK